MYGVFVIVFIFRRKFRVYEKWILKKDGMCLERVDINSAPVSTWRQALALQPEALEI